MFSLNYPDSKEWRVWLSLIISLMIGYPFGSLTKKYTKLGIVILGTFIGGLLGSILYGFIIYIYPPRNSLLILLLTILISAIIIGILSLKYFDYAIIFGSAIGGSYLFIRVILLIFNFYIN